MKKPTAEEIREAGENVFILFGDKSYLPKEYADILFERIERLEEVLNKTSQKATERIEPLEKENERLRNKNNQLIGQLGIKFETDEL